MGSFSISRLPQTSTLSKNLFAFLSSWRTLGGSVCAYSRGVAPLRNFSSISVRTGKKAVHTFQSSSEIVGYGMAIRMTGSPAKRRLLQAIIFNEHIHPSLLIDLLILKSPRLSDCRWSLAQGSSVHGSILLGE